MAFRNGYDEVYRLIADYCHINYALFIDSNALSLLAVCLLTV
ncbi:hypothetical protein HMPREF1584_00777 [Gardnerella vaginalis JCP8481A]|nr:hypothetical protein HMPREF1584_00777 [Gardnerella vaginalis JCP8481A]EPI43413.1 hypothetical protein HMPREF1585_00498 [Gardnerella vaginalis JCP8481B]